MVEKTYLGRAHWAQARLLWQNNIFLKIFRNRKEVENHIKVFQLTCHECSAKDEIENERRKKCSIVEQANLILKKDMEQMENMREKKAWKFGVHSM